MPTKQNPGVFDCHKAAMIDEPIFTILGRDPAGPATLRFWASERRRIGKTETAEDAIRATIAIDEADEMEAWRESNKDWDGEGTPLWKADRITSEGNPVCESLEQQAAQARTLSGLTEIQAAAQKVHDITADLDVRANALGERGIAGALADAEEALVDAVLKWFPDSPEKDEVPISGEYVDELGVKRTTFLPTEPRRTNNPPVQAEVKLLDMDLGEVEERILAVISTNRDSIRQLIVNEGVPFPRKRQPEAPALPEGVGAHVEVHIQAVEEDAARDLAGLIQSDFAELSEKFHKDAPAVRWTCLIDGRQDREFDFVCKPGPDGCAEWDRGEGLRP